MSQPRFLPVDLSGRRVLVTGGAAGIGRVIAEGFLSAGARTRVCDISEDAVAAIRHDLPEIEAVHADVSDPRSVDAMFDAIGREMGGIDILVNDAGIPGPTGPIESLDPEQLRRTLSINVEALFLCAGRAVPMMRRQGFGHVINMSSVAGRLSYSNRTPYSAAKWGVVGFTKSLALEAGRDGIRVNAIMPGHVNSKLFAGVIDRRAATLDLTPEELKARILDLVALKTTVEREDIANMALFLCSPFGSSISGQTLSVCGGVEMMV